MVSPTRALGNLTGTGLILLAMFLSQPAPAGVVTTSADNGPGSLREVLANAPVGDTITFVGGGTITLTSGELVINRDVSIIGPGAGLLKIQRDTTVGTADFRIFRIQSGAVALSGLAISNGRSDYGGGVLIEGGEIIFQGVVVSDNAAEVAGGGVYNESVLDVEDSAFTGNSVQAIDDYGAFGGAIANVGTITSLSRCTFHGNTASGGLAAGGGFGGAINNSGSILSMSDSVLEGNLATGAPGRGNGSGGAINNDFGTMLMTACRVANNSARGGPDGGVGYGGGFNNEYGTAYIETSTLTSNVSSGGAGSSGGLGEGGGVGNAYGTLELDRCTINGNYAVGGDGDTGGSAGPGEGGGIANEGGTVYLSSSTVSGNVAQGGAGAGTASAPCGGGLMNGFGSVVLTYSTIVSNVVPATAPDDGGGVVNFAGVVESLNTIIAANSAEVDVYSYEDAYLFSYGHNVFGSIGGPFSSGASDQPSVSANALKIGPLQDNGGPTLTHALLGGSPALNAGENAGAPAIDQRGYTRIVGGTIDIGAYEAEQLPVVILNPNIRVVTLTYNSDNDSPPGPQVEIGMLVVWTYVVTNPGNEPLENVTVSDSAAGVAAYQHGDQNGNGLLDPGETWIFRASATALLGQQENIGTVTARGHLTQQVVTSSNPDHYFGTPTPCPSGRFRYEVDASTGDLNILFYQFPAPNDNSYGVNSVGWGKRGHLFRDLVASDHAGFQLRDPGGVIRLSFYIDYLSPKAGTPSGYASLGPFGGDGAVLVGTLTPADIAYDTSMARNLNSLGYFANGVQLPSTKTAVNGTDLLVDSPATMNRVSDYTLKTPNPWVNGWDFSDTYYITIKKSKLASLGFNPATWKIEPNLDGLHNSPAKVCPDTFCQFNLGPIAAASKEVRIAITNTANTDSVLTALSLGWPSVNGNLVQVKLNGVLIYDTPDLPWSSGGVRLGESGVQPLISDRLKRTIERGGGELLQLLFQNDIATDLSLYSAVATFGSGCDLPLLPVSNACDVAIGTIIPNGEEIQILVNNKSQLSDVMLTALQVSWPSANGKLMQVKFDGDVIYDAPDIVWSAGGVTLGDAALVQDAPKRTIDLATSDVLRLVFENPVVPDLGLYTATATFGASCKAAVLPPASLCEVAVGPVTPSAKEIQIVLTNGNPQINAIISELRLSWPSSNGKLMQVKLDGDGIYDSPDLLWSSGGVVLGQNGSQPLVSDLGKRTIDIGTSDVLYLVFEKDAATDLSLYGCSTAFGSACQQTILVQTTPPPSDPTNAPPTTVCNLGVGGIKPIGKEIQVTITNTSKTTAALVSALQVVWPVSNGKLLQVKLDGDVIYDAPDLLWSAAGVILGEGGSQPLISDLNKRMIGTATSDVLRFIFENDVNTDLSLYAGTASFGPGCNTVVLPPRSLCNLAVGPLIFNGKEVQVTITNSNPQIGAIVSALRLNWPSANGKLMQVKFDGDVIYDSPDLLWSAGGVVIGSGGSQPLVTDVNKKTIELGTSDVLRLVFETDVVVDRSQYSGSMSFGSACEIPVLP